MRSSRPGRSTTRRRVGEAVDRARLAALWWEELGYEGRRERLLAWKGVITRRMRELAQLMHRENGKPVADATLEIIATIDHLDWAAKHAKKVLGPRSVRPSLMSANQQAILEYQPLGVVGVIGPWNYPVFTPMGSIAYALAAGNAVVFKPSELTPGIGAWLVRMFGEVVPEHPVLQLVTGDGRTGSALARAGVDKISFTGSERTGKKVMAACAETLTPVLMECGGKDAMIVDADANLAAAADAAAWGGVANAGQTCVGIERVYVVDSVRDAFLEHLRAELEGVRAGSDPDASYGPITMPSQVDVIQAHVDDGLARGGAAERSAVPPRSASGSSRRSSSPTCPRTPPRSPRRPSGRSSSSTGCATPTRPSSAPTPPATDWAAPCSPRSAGSSWPGGCAAG